MSEPELVSLVAEILEISPTEITADSDLEELGWDSLSNLTFLSIADARFGTTIDAEELARAETPADLGALLGRSAA
jgi:acyl carrier protein